MRNIHYLITLCIVFIALSCREQKIEFKIEPFDAADEKFSKIHIQYNIRKVNEGRDTIYSEHYLVNSKDTLYESKIDAFACEKMEKRKNNDEVYFLYFFHKTKKTNSEYLRLHPKSYEHHSEQHDRLYDYQQEPKNFRLKYVYLHHFEPIKFDFFICKEN
ncbi:MAG: hypothetical protein WAS72_09885 [Saprospiraceae bacterium]